MAREAGASVPTVYAAYQNKARLTLALADAADLSADVPQLIAELETATAEPEPASPPNAAGQPTASSSGGPRP